MSFLPASYGSRSPSPRGAAPPPGSDATDPSRLVWSPAWAPSPGGRGWTDRSWTADDLPAPLHDASGAHTGWAWPPIDDAHAPARQTPKTYLEAATEAAARPIGAGWSITDVNGRATGRRTGEVGTATAAGPGAPAAMPIAAASGTPAPTANPATPGPMLVQSGVGRSPPRLGGGWPAIALRTGEAALERLAEHVRDPRPATGPAVPAVDPFGTPTGYADPTVGDDALLPGAFEARGKRPPGPDSDAPGAHPGPYAPGVTPPGPGQVAKPFRHLPSRGPIGSYARHEPVEGSRWFDPGDCDQQFEADKQTCAEIKTPSKDNCFSQAKDRRESCINQQTIDPIDIWYR